MMSKEEFVKSFKRDQDKRNLERQRKADEEYSGYRWGLKNKGKYSIDPYPSTNKKAK